MAILFNQDRKILILHVPRTGGSARDRVMKQYGFVQLFGHVRLRDLSRICHVVLSSIETIIAPIRHPAERELSQWMFSMVANPLKGPTHTNINDYVSDWRTTPLWYYERAWHRKFYRDNVWGEGSMQELEAIGYYPYWFAVDGQIPDNVKLVDIANQEKELSELLGEPITIPVVNDTDHQHWTTYFDKRGLDQVRRLYTWSIDRYWPDLRPN